MAETEPTQSDEERQAQLSKEAKDVQDAQTVETVRRWGRTVTVAEKHAIYGSSVRDLKAWGAQKDPETAS